MATLMPMSRKKLVPRVAMAPGVAVRAAANRVRHLGKLERRSRTYNDAVTEVRVCRLTVFAGLVLSLSGCGLGKVILTEDSEDRCVQLREDHASYSSSGPVNLINRPNLKDVREARGDIKSVCREIHGLRNPRIVIESTNRSRYQVLYQKGDQEVLKVIAKPLGLEVTEEEREIKALTIRVSAGGHRLKPAAKDEQVKLINVCCDGDGRWPLYGITADELARFLETRYIRPVVNRTALEGRWSILLSEKAGWYRDEQPPLDDLGLELRWENVKVPVTVVKDKRKATSM